MEERERTSIGRTLGEEGRAAQAASHMLGHLMSNKKIT